MIASAVLLTLAGLFLIEGVFIALFPKRAREMLRDMSKYKGISRLGLAEILVGILFLVLGIVFL